MRVWVSLAAVAALLVAGCSSGAGSGGETSGPTITVKPTETTGVIKGVVVDEAIRPVEGATVSLPAVGTDPARSVTTNEDGAFGFEGLKPGVYFLSVYKVLYDRVQKAVDVVAGVDPDPERIQIRRLAGLNPSWTPYKLDGYYECAFTAIFITDSCDFGVRTAYDYWKEPPAGSPPPVPPPFPRDPLGGANTQYIDVFGNIPTIIQEAFWDDTVAQMMITVDETPIDNACDCSDSYFGTSGMAAPTYARVDRGGGEGRLPENVTVASRGFIPFGAPEVVLAHKFVIITTLFTDYQPEEGWTFQHPSPAPK